MNKINSKIYEIVANAVPVIEISDPILFKALPTENLRSIWETVMEMEQEVEFTLVRDEQKTWGYLDFFDDSNDDLERTTREAANPINPNQIVPGSMPIMDLIPVLAPNLRLFF